MQSCGVSQKVSVGSDLKKKEKKVSPLWEAAMKGAGENRKQGGSRASEEAGKTYSISSAFNLHLSAILMRLIKNI